MTEVKHSIETEHEVLETLMHFGESSNLRVQKAICELNSDCFYNPDNKAIFELINTCFSKDEPFQFVDIAMLTRGNIELHERVQWLMDDYYKFHAGESNFDHYIARLISLSRLRKQILLASSMISQVENCSNPEEASAIFMESINDISAISFAQSKGGISNVHIAEEFYDGKMVTTHRHPTTCETLNTATGGGIMAKSLITIAAGAGVGKTGFSIFLLDIIARAQPDTQTLFFSIEMEAKQIWLRHVGICAGKHFDKLDEDERFMAIGKSLEIPMQIYDATMSRSTADIDYIVTTSRLKAMEQKVSVIVVDYLGLVECKGKFERNDLKQTEITSRLARLAIDLDCIVIALSQINRSPSGRAIEDRCPRPEDASGSSGSYFSSTLWLGLDRPELYQSEPCYRNQFVVKSGKNRYGNPFELILPFNEGTFGEISLGSLDKGMKQPIPPKKSIFTGHSRDYNDR